MQGFTKIGNVVLETILTASLTKKQLKIILLIIRMSFGCQKPYARLKKKDFAAARVSPYHVKEEIEKLVQKRIIRHNPDKEAFSLTDPCAWLGDNYGEKLKAIAKITSKNLPKPQPDNCENSQFKVAKTASSVNEK